MAVGTTGAVELGMPPVGTIAGIGLVIPDTTLAGLGTILVAPGMALVVGTGVADFSILLGSTALTLVPCSL